MATYFVSDGRYREIDRKMRQIMRRLDRGELDPEWVHDALVKVADSGAAGNPSEEEPPEEPWWRKGLVP